MKFQRIFSYHVVIGGIENFLSRLLKDKIPQYHSILRMPLYSDFYTFTNILPRNLQNLSIFIMQLISDEKYLLMSVIKSPILLMYHD